MSRQIDVSDPASLSEEDRKYLQDRGQLPEGAEPVRVRGPKAPPLDEAEYTGDVGARPPRGGSAFEEEEVISEEYEDMGIAQLRKEAKSRGLSGGGTAADIIERLREDDETPVEDDEDEETGE